ncbi:MAG: hypothetical protein WD061_01595 [Candidatus Saccharimonadales bacterium]
MNEILDGDDSSSIEETPSSLIDLSPEELDAFEARIRQNIGDEAFEIALEVADQITRPLSAGIDMPPGYDPNWHPIVKNRKELMRKSIIVATIIMGGAAAVTGAVVHKHRKS